MSRGWHGYHAERGGGPRVSHSRKGWPAPLAVPVPSVVNMTSCDLVLPCRDEAAALPALLGCVPDVFGVIVVDNGSSDATAAVARALGARVVSEPAPGYGAAVQAGIAASDAEYVAVMDGDGSLDPAEVLPLLDCVRGGR